MSEIKLVPAVQYVRMSTENQKYSIEGQASAIEKYAADHGFDIVQTYSDSAKSGVTLKNRPALKQLLQDVVGPIPRFRAILVYDISRFGRFQDSDEAAYYEFVCKLAGIPVHYCAEPFLNDGSLSSLIMKNLKRAMAGEYSRELGVKVRAGQRRVAFRGFKQGGVAGYGLRRMLISDSGGPKQLLEQGERKNVVSDRVLLVPGPAAEVECVREMFRMLISEERTVREIVRELNHRGLRNVSGRDWCYQDVNNILQHPKYCGCNWYGRTTRRLYTATVRTPSSEWILKTGAFEPIIDRTTFLQAQSILFTRTRHLTNAHILERLRTLLAKKGRLSVRLVKDCDYLPAPTTFRHRFGGFRAAYNLIGYTYERPYAIEVRQSVQALRDKLLFKITESSCDRIKILRRTARHRATLLLPTLQTASILVVRSVPVWKETYRWILDPVASERHLPTLVALINRDNTACEHFYVFSRIEFRTRTRMTLNEPWLRSGIKVKDLSKLSHAFAQVMGRPKRVSSST